jgi:hypothetical protein
MDKFAERLEGYFCGWEDATGDCPSKEQILKYLITTFDLTTEKALDIVKEHCDGWYEFIPSDDDE